MKMSVWENLFRIQGFNFSIKSSFTFFRRIFLPSLCILLTCSCKTNSVSEAEESNISFTASEKVSMTYNSLNYSLNNRQMLTGEDIANAGLWIATIQNGIPAANLVFQGAIPYSNYIASFGNHSTGVFKFLADGKKLYANSFIRSLGLPLNLDGSIKVMGDEMYFSSFASDTTLGSVSIFANPIKNIRVNQTLFGYKRIDINDVVFIKYDITNLGKVEQVLNAGYYSDTDIETPSNSTGYDSLRGLTYTYLPKPLRNPNKAIGFAFLDSPKMNGNKPIILSHRIVRKNDASSFSEHFFKKPQQALWALNGLDNDGNPMINPITNQITKFAFTGDPITGTGWLDILVDTRNLLSTASFNLMPNQTTTLIVVLLCSEAETYKESIPKLKEKLDKIRNQTELWKF